MMNGHDTRPCGGCPRCEKVIIFELNGCPCPCHDGWVRKELLDEAVTLTLREARDYIERVIGHPAGNDKRAEILATINLLLDE
jgi:hypothetical protein